jgi:hypothetical protein
VLIDLIGLPALHVSNISQWSTATVSATIFRTLLGTINYAMENPEVVTVR